MKPIFIFSIICGWAAVMSFTTPQFHAKLKLDMQLSDTIVQPSIIYPDTIVVEQDTLIAATVSSFHVNDSAGWGSYSSFLAKVGDSVQLELILFRNVADSAIWFQDSYAGSIDAQFIPATDQFLEHNEQDRRWFIRIGIDGKFLIRLINGPAPGGAFSILPLQLRYKK